MDNQPVTISPNRPATPRHDIPGWGVDADPRNDATYPMRDRTRDDSPGMNWTRPTQQASDVEILQSVEHNRRPAVFGTSTPPSGLSGMIRRTAFAYSESQWAHWLLLILADRVNSAEGVLTDIASGVAPNVFQEMGMAAEWKHDRDGYIQRVTTTVALTGAAAGIAYLMLRTRRRRLATAHGLAV